MADLALDDGRPQGSLGSVVGGLDSLSRVPSIGVKAESPAPA
jgi:hypothetical protein